MSTEKIMIREKIREITENLILVLERGLILFVKLQRREDFMGKLCMDCIECTDSI